jgi:uncharacterized protein with FMN-binding domain
MISRPRLRAVAVLGVTATLALSACTSADESTSSAPPSPGTSSPATTPETTPRRTYRDGTYTADGWYGGQPSRIGVRLTLANGAISSVTITNYATDPTSLGFQRDFAAAVPAAVVGKPIDQANVERLAGASGTSEGWNSALELIRRQASP